MRNVWKGLVIGGLTGAGVGVLIDVLDRGVTRAGELGSLVASHAPETASHLRDAVSGAVAEGAARAHDPERVEHMKASATSALRKVRDAADETKQAVIAAAGDASDRASVPLAEARDKAGSAGTAGWRKVNATVDRAKDQSATTVAAARDAVSAAS